MTHLPYILGLTVCLSAAAIATPVKALVHQESFAADEIQECEVQIVSLVNQFTDSVYSLPNTQHSYDNALHLWDQLQGDLQYEFSRLEKIAASHSPYSETATQAIDDLDKFASQNLNDSRLHKILTTVSEGLLQDSASDSFQKYIALSYLQGSHLTPAYLQGASQEKTSEDAHFSLFNLDLALFDDTQDFKDIAKSAFEDADIVYIQSIAGAENAHDLYKALQQDYAHFIYLPSHSHQKDGLLVASKYSLNRVLIPKMHIQKHENSFDCNFHSYTQTNRNLQIILVGRDDKRDRDGDRGRDNRSKGIEYDAGITFEYKWGGEDGPRFSFGGSASAKDRNGSYFEGKAQRFDNGENSVKFEGGKKGEKN
ncbi:MAG TPA: hypothetical protein VGJ00_09965 [Rhabdochlamydiaceae bacterium]|jgi:hypothetical protein